MSKHLLPIILVCLVFALSLSSSVSAAYEPQPLQGADTLFSSSDEESISSSDISTDSELPSLSGKLTSTIIYVIGMLSYLVAMIFLTLFVLSLVAPGLFERLQSKLESKGFYLANSFGGALISFILPTVFGVLCTTGLLYNFLVAMYQKLFGVSGGIL